MTRLFSRTVMEVSSTLRRMSGVVLSYVLVWLFSPRGEPLYRIDSPEGLYTTNCAYGGADGRTLYMVESRSGCILTARVPVAGRPMYSHSAR